MCIRDRNKEVQVVVVTPDAASGKKAVACPTIYLLHGYGGKMCIRDRVRVRLIYYFTLLMS